MVHREEDLLSREEEVDEDLGVGGEADPGSEPLLDGSLGHGDAVNKAAVALGESVISVLHPDL